MDRELGLWPEEEFHDASIQRSKGEILVFLSQLRVSGRPILYQAYFDGIDVRRWTYGHERGSALEGQVSDHRRSLSEVMRQDMWSWSGLNNSQIVSTSRASISTWVGTYPGNTLDPPYAWLAWSLVSRWNQWSRVKYIWLHPMYDASQIMIICASNYHWNHWFICCVVDACQYVSMPHSVFNCTK